MKIGISGSREVKKYKVLKDFLDRFNQEKTKIIHGDCKKGIDKFAKRYAKENNIKELPIPARWHDLSKRDRYEPLILRKNKFGDTINIMAGKERNHSIVLNSDILIAFWKDKSNGTEHCFKIAKNKYKKPVIVVHIDYKDEIEKIEFFNIDEKSIYINEKGGLF